VIPQEKSHKAECWFLRPTPKKEDKIPKENYYKKEASASLTRIPKILVGFFLEKHIKNRSSISWSPSYTAISAILQLVHLSF
jgi:hypothetical protein